LKREKNGTLKVSRKEVIDMLHSVLPEE